MKRLFLNDRFILVLILINAFVIFISGFDLSESLRIFFNVFDNIITLLFVVELLVKIKEYSFKGYWESAWNRFDFVLIILSLPFLFSFLFNIETANVSFLLVFRVLRVFKSFRFLKFIPGITQLLNGIKRAIKSSVLVLLGFAVYVFIVGIFSFYLFRGVSAEFFGDPLKSLYTVFRIFTIDGWYEIPDKLTSSFSNIEAFFTYAYFIFVLLTGGILGLSLVNSIFVDAMVSDNNDEIERKIDVIDKKIDELSNLLNTKK